MFNRVICLAGFVAVVSMCSTMAGAVVVQTDIPDELVKGSWYMDEFLEIHTTNDTFTIDLDGDTVGDVRITHSYIPTAGAGVEAASYATGLNGALKVIDAGNVAVLAEGTLVGPASVFGTASKLFIDSIGDGNWGGQQGKYLGVQFKIGTDWHYGWVHMSVANDAAVTIHDYAYETDPNTAITTPEPATLVMLGLGGLAVIKRRRIR